MLQLEVTLGEAYNWAGLPGRASRLKTAARRRKAAIREHFWNARSGVYEDLLWEEGRLTGIVSAATLYPLFIGIASTRRGRAVAAAVRTKLLMPGGIVATALQSGQQWDSPNGWAPLQWIAVAGLSNYDEAALATEIAERWIAKVGAVYRATGKLMEKYDVVSEDLTTGGGEYPNQDGFGWTNGVTRELMARYPSAMPETGPESRIANELAEEISAHGSW